MPHSPAPARHASAQPTRDAQHARKAADREREQPVQPALVLLAARHPRVVPGLRKVEQDDHLDDEEQAAAKARRPACATRVCVCVCV
jgi:hypothetical protein